MDHPPASPQNALLSGLGWCGLPPKSPNKGGKKVHVFMGVVPRLKTVPNFTLGAPKYVMTNASNFRWGIPPASNPKGCENGGLYS